MLVYQLHKVSLGKSLAVLVHHINEVRTSMEIHDSCFNLVISAGNLFLITSSILPGDSSLSLQHHITPAVTTATWSLRQFEVLQSNSSRMQRCRVSNKSITLNGSNIQSPSEKRPFKGADGSEVWWEVHHWFCSGNIQLCGYKFTEVLWHTESQITGYVSKNVKVLQHLMIGKNTWT